MYKELLQELMNAIDSGVSSESIRNSPLAVRIDAALEQPEPVAKGPTDQELADAFAEGCLYSSKSGEPPFLGGARAVLARYGHQPTPVPVRERLPRPEDCDAEGRCWVHQPHEACPESPAWELMLAKYASPNYGATCWLPATALPLPSGEVEA